MDLVRFVTHPEVRIDPDVLVPDWGLSQVGRTRIERAVQGSLLGGCTSLFTSAERKAREAADIVARKTGLSARILDDLGENDRSATGYLPKPEFEAMADRFFAEPETQVCGWESARDAQDRVLAAIEVALGRAAPTGHVLIVAHGAVGALTLCHLKGIAITRAADQPGAGGGNVFAFERGSRRLVHDWRPLEAL